VNSAIRSDRASASEPANINLVGQLQSGQLSEGQYLDIRVEQAVNHLIGRITAEQVDIVRATLRERLSTDPLLISMARRATSTLGRR
jgi:hypothetical protein